MRAFPLVEMPDWPPHYEVKFPYTGHKGLQVTHRLNTLLPDGGHANINPSDAYYHAMGLVRSMEWIAKLVSDPCHNVHMKRKQAELLNIHIGEALTQQLRRRLVRVARAFLLKSAELAERRRAADPVRKCAACAIEAVKSQIARASRAPTPSVSACDLCLSVRVSVCVGGYLPPLCASKHAINGHKRVHCARSPGHVRCSCVGFVAVRKTTRQATDCQRARCERTVPPRLQKAQGAGGADNADPGTQSQVSLPVSSHRGRAGRAPKDVGHRMHVLLARRDAEGECHASWLFACFTKVQLEVWAEADLGGHTAGADAQQEGQRLEPSQGIHRHAFVSCKACHISHVREASTCRPRSRW